MKIIYMYKLLYNEFNLPSVCATNQHFIDDDFIGCPDDYANLTDAIFSTSLFEEKLVCIFLLDEENEVHGVFRIEYFEGINLQSICQDIFTKFYQPVLKNMFLSNVIQNGTGKLLLKMKKCLYILVKSDVC